jgi:hypothetical protein
VYPFVKGLYQEPSPSVTYFNIYSAYPRNRKPGFESR